MESDWKDDKPLLRFASLLAPWLFATPFSPPFSERFSRF